MKYPYIKNKENASFYNKKSHEAISTKLQAALRLSEQNYRRIKEKITQNTVVIYKNFCYPKRKRGICVSDIQKLNSFPKIVADCFIPLGSACRPARWLKVWNLRYCSLPFDWLMKFSLDTVSSMLIQGSSSLLKEYKEDPSWKGRWRSVSDTKNNITILHDFPRDESVEQHIPIFQEKFMRRCKRMKRIFKTYDDICFICNRGENISEFLAFSLEMMKFNPKLKINFVNIRHSENDGDILCQSSGNITIYDVHANDVNENNDPQFNPWAWLGNERLWNKLCSNFSLSQKVKYQLIGNQNIDSFLKPENSFWDKFFRKKS